MNIELLANVRNGHAEAFRVKRERPLPGRTREGAHVVVLEPRIRVHEIGVAYFTQDRGQKDVGDGEILARDPLTPVQPSLQPIEPPLGDIEPSSLARSVATSINVPIWFSAISSERPSIPPVAMSLSKVRWISGIIRRLSGLGDAQSRKLRS
jgi:hypothetical protein